MAAAAFRREESRNPALVLVSEHEQQSSASNLTLPYQQDQQIGKQTQSASTPLDQPQGGSGQYQPSGNDQTPTPTGVPVQYQPAGNDLTPPSGANANSDAIAEAALTHLISRDDDAQGQDATSDQDAPMPDAPAVHDIATPRRTIGGRCRKRCISAQSCLTVNASVLPVVCVGHDAVMVKHVSNSEVNRETNHH